MEHKRKIEGKTLNVRSYPEKMSNSRLWHGVVDEVDEQSMTVGSLESGDGDVKSVVMYPCDILAAGKVVKSARGGGAYLWSDVKKGDKVLIEAIRDDGEEKVYAFHIYITRRPGAKLPVSQDPKRDDRHAKDSLLNDIDNGLDVSDEDITTLFPGKTIFHPRTGAPEFVRPAGLTKEYQKKLDAIREKAKKDKDLKATPPDKK
jgi:hypothetical protein